MGRGSAIRAQDGQTPAGVRVPGGRGRQLLDGLGVEQPEPGGLPRGGGQAQQGGQRHGDVDQRRHARAVVPAGLAGVAVAAGPRWAALGFAGPAEATCRLRLSSGGLRKTGG